VVLYQPHAARLAPAVVGEYPAPPTRWALAYMACVTLRVDRWLAAGLAGATISLAVSPGWFSELTTGGQGWIAVGLVIFAQWDPWRAAAAATCSARSAA